MLFPIVTAHMHKTSGGATEAQHDSRQMSALLLTRADRTKYSPLKLKPYLETNVC